MAERDLKAVEVAQRLGLHTNTVKRMLKRGELSGYRIGTRGDWRVTHEALETFRRGGLDTEENH